MHFHGMFDAMIEIIVKTRDLSVVFRRHTAGSQKHEIAKRRHERQRENQVPPLQQFG
jgi:hypothetical protein